MTPSSQELESPGNPGRFSFFDFLGIGGSLSPSGDGLLADLFLGRPRSRSYPKFNIRRDIPELEEEIHGYLDSFPDLKWNIDNIFAHDDQVLVEISGIGTRSTKAIDGGKPGTRVQFWVASVEHVGGGKIDRMRAYIVQEELDK